MHLKPLLFAVACCIAHPVAAEGFRAVNHVVVTAVPGGFDVAGGGGFGARGMWCAAADYAKRVRGARGVDRIYIAQGRTPGIGQRAPVRFTLSSDGLTPASVFVVDASLRQAGANLSVDHAYGFCSDTQGRHR